MCGSVHVGCKSVCSFYRSASVFKCYECGETSFVTGDMNSGV